MIRLVPTTKPAAILQFMRGDAIRRKCNGGRDVSGIDLEKAIKASKGVFLVAVEDDKKGLGFVMLNPEAPDTYSIHICVRTIGEKTKRIFALAIQYAKFVLGAVALDAVYPASYRACKRLGVFFGFKEMKSLAPYYQKRGIDSKDNYLYQRLQLA